LDNAKRTAFYRLAQEALTNVARHSHASYVKVTVQKLARAITMEIADDGKGFEVDRVLMVKGNNRLGVLGMRERVQMVGGQFKLESSPGIGTTVRAQIPLGKGRRRREHPHR
jgi:signal transduction histidine kinase